MKNKVVLIMPGEIGFYLRGTVPDFIAQADFAQNFLGHLFGRGVTLPLSLIAIAPYLRREGFDVVIIDGRIEDARTRIREEIDSRTVFAGITALTGSMIRFGLYCAEAVRQAKPDLPIVWGGVHVTLTPEQSLRSSDLVDIIVRGEGEWTSSELARALASGSDLSEVQGISWKKNGNILHNPDRPFMNFDEQLPLDYDLISPDHYDIQNTLLYQSERGCPHRCAFCDVLVVHRRKFRKKSVGQVLEDMKFLKEKFNPNKIHFVDDCFFADLKRARAIMDGLIEMNLDLKWHTSCRAQYVRRTNRAFWESAKRAGLTEVYVGAESGSQRILDYIKKDCTLEDIRDAAEQICGAGLLFWTNFMTGFPGETREDIRKTIDLIDFLNETYGERMRIGRIFLYAPCPGTPMHDEVVKAGYRPPETLKDWGDFRIGDLSHTLWHPEAKYMAAVSLCSKYGRENRQLDIVGRVNRGFRNHNLKTFARLLLLKLPEIARSVAGRRAYRKWVERDFRFTTELKLLRWIHMTFDTW
jgi:anaerobic magnesium-protoporphyrin IX monomethyl ester cyclase